MTIDPLGPRRGGPMTVQEYLQLNKATSDARYEYLNGVARLMPQTSAEHDTIVQNVYNALNRRLAPGSYAVFRSDVQTYVMDQAVSQENYFYPDVIVSAHAADCQPGTWLIKSPCVVVEVIAPATEHIDRGRKLAAYKACPSIQEIVLIELPEVEVHRRVENRTSWRYIVYGSHEEIKLSSIDVSIPMSEIFSEKGKVGWEEYATSIEEYHHLHERYNVSFEYINGNVSLHDTPVLLLGGVAAKNTSSQTALALISDVTKEEAKQLAAFVAFLRREKRES